MIDPRDTAGIIELWFYDYVAIMFVASFLLEDIIGIFARKWIFFSSFWSFYSLINHTLFIVGIIMTYSGYQQLHHDHRHSISGDHVVNVGSTFVSVAASMAFFRVTRWFLLQRTLGPMIVCIIQILWDGLHVLMLFIIIFISFAIGHYSMFKTFTMTALNSTMAYGMEKPDLADRKLVFSTLFWRVFSAGYPEYASINRKTDTGPEELSLEFSHFMGLVLWAVYQSIIVLLLINILIAMMNTTYTRVWDEADLHWNYSKSFYQVQFLKPKAVFPPPFTVFYYFAKLMRHIKEKGNTENSKEVQDKEDGEYWDLLRKLLKKKRFADYNSSIKEDFSDLRKDIQNIVNLQLKGIMEEFERRNQKKKKSNF